MQNIRLKLAAALLILPALAMVLTATVRADDTSQTTTQVVTSQNSAQVIGANASAEDISSGSVTVLSFNKANGMTMKQRQQPGCRTITGVWNSGRGSDGQLHWFWDTRTIHICPTNESPSGWAKVDCDNPVRFMQPEKNIVTGRVIMVRSRAQVNIQVTASATVKVTAVCGSAEASAQSSAIVSLDEFVRASGNASTRIFDQAVAEATAKASAKLDCVTQPATTTTTTTTTPTVQPAVVERVVVKEVPKKVVVHVPAEEKGKEALPNTGPASVAATFAGVSSLAGVGHYLFRRYYN